VRSVLVAVLLPVVVVLVIGPYTFLPSILEYAVARDVQSRLGLEKAPEVNLESDPPLRMLSGEFSGGRIVLKNADLGGVRAQSTSIDLDPFDVDVVESLGKGSVVAREPLSGGLRVELGEAEVSRLAKKSADVPVRGVDVKESGVAVRSEAAFLGSTFPATATGDLNLSEGSLVFEPRSLEAAGLPVPQELARQLLAGTGFEYPLDGLPYKSEITRVETAEGRLVLVGRVPRVPVGVYPGG
jgi:LmeA-like phospholipid-binding